MVTEAWYCGLLWFTMWTDISDFSTQELNKTFPFSTQDFCEGGLPHSVVSRIAEGIMKSLVYP